MNLFGRKTQRQLDLQLDAARFLLDEYRGQAWTALGRRDYSAAAAACHRAYQQDLIIRELELAVTR